MIKWLHHLFNPHCDECRLEKQENKICSSCETLKLELEAERYNNRQLLDSVLKHLNPEPVVAPVVEEKQYVPRAVSWRVKKEMLEAEDRRAAQVMKQKKSEIYESSKSTEQLEKELLGEDDASKVS